jgi:integrase
MKRNKRTKVKRIIHAGIPIREIRTGYFMIDCQKEGRRSRQCFSDLGSAKVAAEQLAVKVRNEGASVLDLTADQRGDAVKALRELHGSTSLLSAARFWMRHNAVTGGCTVQELADRWVNALRAKGCRDTTLGERGYKTARLCRDLGQRPVASITRDDLLAWMDGYRLKAETRDGYRRCYRAMFQYAVKERLLEANPAAAIDVIVGDEKLPTPFTVDAVRRIMAAAENYAPVMVPTLAVQFFAGLRPGEAKGLLWTAIDFEENTIRIAPETSKVRRTRIIDMNPTCRAWLLPYRRKDGPVGIETQSQFSYSMVVKDCGGRRGVIAAAGVKWLQDGPRKTFASMHYATHGDAAKLASTLGHTGGHDVLFRHYRGLVKKSDAATYWTLRPASAKSNVLQFQAAS